MKDTNHIAHAKLLRPKELRFVSRDPLRHSVAKIQEQSWRSDVRRSRPAAALPDVLPAAAAARVRACKGEGNAGKLRREAAEQRQGAEPVSACVQCAVHSGKDNVQSTSFRYWLL